MEQPPDFTWLLRLIGEALLVCTAILLTFTGIAHLLSN
jgi:hypothetical protein